MVHLSPGREKKSPEWDQWCKTSPNVDQPLHSLAVFGLIPQSGDKSPLNLGHTRTVTKEQHKLCVLQLLLKDSPSPAGKNGFILQEFTLGKKNKIAKQINATNWVSCSLPIESLWNFISVCFRGEKGTSKKQIIVFTELFLCSWALGGKQWEWAGHVVTWLTDKLLNGPTSQAAAANLGWHLFIIFLSCCSFPLPFLPAWHYPHFSFQQDKASKGSRCWGKIPSQMLPCARRQLQVIKVYCCVFLASHF